MIVDSEKCWAVFDEENDKICFIFRNRDEALIKLAEFDDDTPYQIARISLEDSIWNVNILSWKTLVLDLIRKSREPQEHSPTEEVEITTEEA